jgi:hypothetical protein
MNEPLNYAALLDLARREANIEFENSWPEFLRIQLEDQRKKLVVRKFLERICPIPVEEAR